MRPGARVDHGPLQELWGAAGMPPPPGPAAPEAGAALCFTAAPALILPSVKGMVHSETTQHRSFFLSRHNAGEKIVGKRVYRLMGKFLAGVCNIKVFVHVAIAAKM